MQNTNYGVNKGPVECGDAEKLVWTNQLPKLALHRHLEGSLRLKTLTEIAREHKIELPAYDIEGLRPYVQITDKDPRDFHNYLGKFRLLRYFYYSKAVIQRLVEEVILDAAADNILYLELRFNPVALSRIQKFPLDDVVSWVEEATAKAQQKCGTRTCLILQIGREESLDVANEIVEIAIAHRGPFVRAVDLAGDEVKYPPDVFESSFQRALAAGVHVTIHAGEAVGADSVAAAVKILGAQRIGHGIHSIEDLKVVQLLLDRHVTLEVCPTSNRQTGVVTDLAQHPLRELFNLGVSVTINTDNPSISATTVSQEYRVALQDIGMEKWMIYRTLCNSLDAAFIPDDERDMLHDNFRQALRAYSDAQAVLDAFDRPL